LTSSLTILAGEKRAWYGMSAYGYGFEYRQIIGNSSSNREGYGIKNFNGRDLPFTSPT